MAGVTHSATCFSVMERSAVETATFEWRSLECAPCVVVMPAVLRFSRPAGPVEFDFRLLLTWPSISSAARMTPVKCHFLMSQSLRLDLVALLAATWSLARRVHLELKASRKVWPCSCCCSCASDWPSPTEAIPSKASKNPDELSLSLSLRGGGAATTCKDNYDGIMQQRLA